MNEHEITVLETQAGLVKSSMKDGCPGSCFAASFLKNYARLFSLYLERDIELKDLKILYGRLERRLIALDNWKKTVDEVSEPNGR